MPRILMVLTALLILSASVATADESYVRLTTDEGEILLEMKSELAPNHVANFVHLCRTGFYDGTSFHRVIPGFMIQGGDPNSRDDDNSDDGTGGPTWADVLTADDAAKVAEVSKILVDRGYAGLDDRAQIRAEFNSGHHVHGTLSMARSKSPDSGGSQFFLCVADTPHLDGKYTIFGQVVMGLDVLDVIVAAERNARDNPLTPIRIKKAEVFTGVAQLSDEERTAVETVDAVPATLE